jgi:predicted TIM-barrel fold metal-dependent hydrolase
LPNEALKLMDEAGVAAAVIHPPSWDPVSLDVAVDAVTKHPSRFAIMGSVPLSEPDSWSALSAWRETPGMLGLRFTFLSDPNRALLHAGDLDPLWAEAGRLGLPVALLATGSLEVLDGVAARFPRLKLTIDHLGGRGGLTTLKDHEAFTHMPALLRLARHSNVAVKATGAPGYSAQPYPFSIVQSYVRQVVDAFGPKRVFWGTDITKMPCSWRECITMFTEAMDGLSASDLDWIMGRGICEWWDWRRAVG